MTFEILIGTYEEFVLGYQLIKTEDEENKYSLSQTFVTHSHTASVRSVAATSKLAASSGADETVVLYDMVKRKQSGAINKQEGTITCLKFTPDGSHLISCSDDGSIAIFRVGSWQLEKIFKKAHKGTAVNHIAIHPSGKLAMSVGKDKTLRTWNLIKGRSAYITNLSSYGVAFDNLDQVVWSPEGMMYAIPIQKKAVVFSVEKAGILHTLPSTCKVHCVCFLNETIACTGNEESTITAYNLTDGSELWTVKASSSRVKGLAFHESRLICITSAGDLVVWDCGDLSGEPQRMAATNDGCRFTCLTIRPAVVSDSVVSDSNVRTKKKKKKSNMAIVSELAAASQATTDSAIPTSESKPEVEVINVSISEGVWARAMNRVYNVDSEDENVEHKEDTEDGNVENSDVSIGKRSKKKKKSSNIVENTEETVEESAEESNVSTGEGRKKKKKKKSSNIVEETQEMAKESDISAGEGSKKKKNKARKSPLKNVDSQDTSDAVSTGSITKKGKKRVSFKENDETVDISINRIGETKKALKRKSSDRNIDTVVVENKREGKKNKKGVKEEFVDISGKKKKKSIDQTKLISKKKKRQGTFG